MTTSGNELLYNGPLRISCPCVPQHSPFRRTDELADFVYSSSHSPGKFGVVDGSQLCLRDGEFLFAAALPSPVFFLKKKNFSLAQGLLTRALLADIANSGQVSAFLETLVPSGTLSTKRSESGTACRVHLRHCGLESIDGDTTVYLFVAL